MFIKRIFDIFLVFVLLITLAVPMIVIATLIKIDSKGSMFYRQERVMAYSRHFRIHKFRTMVMNFKKIGTGVTVGNDGRIKKSGFKLRRCKLDELPQVFDVIKGDMSFVDTRLEAVKYVQQYEPKYYAMLLTPAGIMSET